jgi:hypothetical protein
MFLRSGAEYRGRHTPNLGCLLGRNVPEPRTVEPPERDRVVAEPMVGCLQHRYRHCG